MTNYSLQEIELLESALNAYIRNLYANIIDFDMGEHYCYLERNLMYVILSRSLDKTLKKQEEYMKTLNMVIPRSGALF